MQPGPPRLHQQHEEQDSESCTGGSSEEGLNSVAKEAARPGRCQRARALAPLFALAAAASFVVLRPTTKADAGSIAKAVSFESELWTLDSPGTGCSNWKIAALGNYLSVTSADDCGDKCAAQGGCVGFNYQSKHTSDCGDDGGIGFGSCFLWGGACEIQQNACWDNYNLVSPTPLPWALKLRRTGCQDWSASAIGGTYTNEFNANSCGLKCKQTPGCNMFNFQPGPCAGQEESVAQGTCILFEQTSCTLQPDTCKDMYEMVVDPIESTSIDPLNPIEPTTDEDVPATPSPPPHGVPGSMAELSRTAIATSTILFVNAPPPFDPGNVVQVGAGQTMESAEILEVNRTDNSITLARPLKFTYQTGTDVTFGVTVFVTTVVVEREAGRKSLMLADKKNFKVGDPVSIGNDPEGPYQCNEIAEIVESTNTITLNSPLVYKIAANTQFRKIYASGSAI